MKCIWLLGSPDLTIMYSAHRVAVHVYCTVHLNTGACAIVYFYNVQCHASTALSFRRIAIAILGSLCDFQWDRVEN